MEGGSLASTTLTLLAGSPAPSYPGTLLIDNANVTTDTTQASIESQRRKTGPYQRGIARMLAGQPEEQRLKRGFALAQGRQQTVVVPPRQVELDHRVARPMGTFKVGATAIPILRPLRRIEDREDTKP